MIRFRVIDGYNLMHAAGMARQKYGPGDLERCRHRLLLFLAERLTLEERQRTTVIFDAHESPYNAPSRQRFRKIQIEFAEEEDGSADAAIEDFIRYHSTPKQLDVISSDHRICDAARKRKAKSITSDAFLNELMKRAIEADEQGTQAGNTKPDSINQVEVSYWLSEFGEVTTDDEEIDVENLVIDDLQNQSRAASTQSNTEQPEGTNQKSPQKSEHPNNEADFWQQQIDDLLREEESGAADD